MNSIFLVAGPSQIGKDSLIRALVRDYSWRAYVNITTRAPRDGEVDGVDYSFVNVPTFHQLILAGAFLDWDFTAGNYYGIPLDSGPPAPVPIVMHCLSRMAIRLEIRARRYVPILLLPKSIESHRQRIKRSFRSEQEALQRLSMFDEELTHAPLFRRVIYVEDFASSKTVMKEFMSVTQELI